MNRANSARSWHYARLKKSYPRTIGTRSVLENKFDVLLYDLTSTYFESSRSTDENHKRRYGCSRDKRSDCVQMVIALVVTPEGFPLAYEVLPNPM
jgi:transposase